jgi:hypothetical protein
LFLTGTTFEYWKVRLQYNRAVLDSLGLPFISRIFEGKRERREEEGERAREEHLERQDLVVLGLVFEVAQRYRGECHTALAGSLLRRHPLQYNSKGHPIHPFNPFHSIPFQEEDRTCPTGVMFNISKTTSASMVFTGAKGPSDWLMGT